MLRFSLIDGEMVETEQGEYVLWTDVVATDIVAANTLIVQLESLKAQIESWYGETT